MVSGQMVSVQDRQCPCWGEKKVASTVEVSTDVELREIRNKLLAVGRDEYTATFGALGVCRYLPVNPRKAEIRFEIMQISQFPTSPSHCDHGFFVLANDTLRCLGGGIEAVRPCP